MDDHQSESSFLQSPGRRTFLTNTALVGATLVALPMTAAAADQPQNINKAEAAMKIRKLGSLEVSELGAGCMSISANYGPPADRAQGIKAIRAALREA